MTKKPKRETDDEVGYGKPPRHSQWPKGKSGNPKGAPKKKDTPSMASSVRFPTRSIIRNEGSRTIVIREGEERKEVTLTQGVLMQMGNTALKGGVLAQRSFLELQMAEDERHHADRKATFDYWADYKSEAKALIKAALEADKEPPQILPHPDDIILKYATLEVDIVGPVNEEDLQHAKFKTDIRDLSYELSIYLNEGNKAVPGDDEASRVGTMMAIFIIFELNMPPSLKVDMDKLNQQVWKRARQGRRDWAKYLDQKCAELGLPCVGYRVVRKERKSYPLHYWDLGWTDGGIGFV